MTSRVKSLPELDQLVIRAATRMVDAPDADKLNNAYAELRAAVLERKGVWNRIKSQRGQGMVYDDDGLVLIRGGKQLPHRLRCIQEGFAAGANLGAIH